jgi:hypothetical protein
MRSIHDNHLLGYSVSVRDRTIIFETEYPHSSPPERTTIQFEDVQAYFFQNDLMGTILFEIEEVSAGTLHVAYKSQFEEGLRYGWPLGWKHDSESIFEFTARLGLKCFDVSSSYGLCGWVMCKDINIK